MPEAVRLGEMLKCAERELAIRRGVFPKMIERGAFTKEWADREIRLMADIVDYLRRDLEA